MAVIVFVLTWLELCISFSQIGQSEATTLGPYSENEVNFTWPMVNELLANLVDSVLNLHSPNFLKFALKADLSETCQDALLKALHSLRNSEGWAVKMFDATGKIPSGILEGTVMDFGSYDECLKIKTDFSNLSYSQELLGQYCMVGFRTPLLSPLNEKTKSGQTYAEAYGDQPEWMDDILRKGEKFLKKIDFWFGICVPSLCDARDVKTAFHHLMKRYGFTTTVMDCHKNSPIEWSNYQIAAVSFLSTICFVVLIGTTVDFLSCLLPNKLLASFNTNFLVRMFRAFSLCSTMEIFLNCGNAEGNLDFFNGIRFFSAMWIILGHTCFFTDTWKYLKFRRLLGVPDIFNGKFPIAVIENFTLPVGSFFFMSGFLLTYTNWRRLEESNGRLNVLMFFFHKYFRMTPALAATIALFFALPLIDSGPIWNSTLDPPTVACKNTWWANFFYVQNWWNADDFCLLHTWYLAALMQFHIAAVLLLLLVFKYPLVGSVITCAVIMVCTVLTGLLSAWHNFPMPAPGTVKDIDVIMEYVSFVYIKPYSHISSYVIGMIIGYIVLKHQTVKLSLVIGWILSGLFSLAVIYGIYGPSQTPGVPAVYISLHRIGWALGIGWLAFCCATGRGGVINRILSWKVLAPLGQLSYLAYLLHPLVLWYRTASLRERMYFGYTEMAYLFIGHTVMGYFLAFICYLTVELPFASLENLIFRSRTFNMDCLTQKANGTPKITALSVKPTEA